MYLFIPHSSQFSFCDSDQHKHLNQFVRIDKRSFLVILQPFLAVPAGQTIECGFFFFLFFLILGTSGDQNEKRHKEMRVRFARETFFSNFMFKDAENVSSGEKEEPPAPAALPQRFSSSPVVLPLLFLFPSNSPAATRVLLVSASARTA